MPCRLSISQQKYASTGGQRGTEKQKWLIQWVEDILLVSKPPREQRMTVCQPTSFFFFLKVSYTCLMVTDIFSCRKKTEVHLENFPGQEKMLKYLVHSLPVCCHQQHLRTQQLSPSIFSFIRPEKPQHSSGAYCSLPSQASLGNF